MNEIVKNVDFWMDYTTLSICDLITRMLIAIVAILKCWKTTRALFSCIHVLSKDKKLKKRNQEK